jgi:aspartate kinase
LFPDPEHTIYSTIAMVFSVVEKKLSLDPGLDYDFEYDQIVCMGEIMSTHIVAAYLKECGIESRWMDIRSSLKSDDSYREGKINWPLSEAMITKNFVFDENQLIVTQGFIASDISNSSVSLGREGSDYTASIMGYILDAEKIVIWKDVPGILNADPAYYPDAVLLPEISFRDAIELAYYGAKVIHPKTIQPLKKKNISLHVKSFLNPDAPGTVIGDKQYDKLIPSFIFKEDQVIVHFFPEDFSFVSEHNLELILGCFARNGLRISPVRDPAKRE